MDVPEQVGGFKTGGCLRALVVLALVTSPVQAAGDQIGSLLPAGVSAAATAPADASAALPDDPVPPAAATAPEPDGANDRAQLPREPAPAGDHSTSTYVLRGLYGSFATLQALDVVSTRRLLAQGGREVNPLIRPVANNTGALIAVKAASTVTTIVLTNRLARKSRVGAIVTAAALNSLYVVVVSNNFAAARGAGR